MPGRHANPRRRPIVFGPFSIDPVEGTLRRDSVVVPLRRKSWEVLRHLAERPHVLVSNDDLLDAVWPDVHVTPQTLTNVIREIRMALGDDAQSPRIIETVHRRGHVFRGAAATSARQPAALRRAVGAPVARECELAFLERAWTDACEGATRLVFVSGEPGIGKTTLAETFVAGCAGGDTRRPWIARGACLDQHGRGEPYMPLLEAIERLIGDPDTRDVRARLKRFAPTWLVQLPWRLSLAERQRLERQLDGTTPARMLREGVAFVGVLAAAHPLILVLEDLHWADLATLDFLAALGRRPVAAPLLVLATYRAVDAALRAHPVGTLVHDLVQAGHATELALKPFDPPAVHAYLASRLGDPTIAGVLAGPLEEHSAGNPLFLRSLVDELVAQGELVATAAGWQLAGNPTRVRVTLPQSLRDFVAGELARLPAAQRAMLEAASVAGLEFTAAEIAPAAAAPAADIEAACEELARLGRLLRIVGDVAGPDGDTVRLYGFVHAAHRRMVDEQLAPLRRQALHRDLVLGLEAVHGDRTEAIAARLAMHCAHGRLAAKAAAYHEQAAANAERRFAYREGAEHLRAALACMAESAATDADSQVRIAALHLRLGGFLGPGVGYARAEVADELERARTLFESADAPAGVFMAVAGLCRTHMARGDFRAGCVHADRLLALARDGLPALTAVACLWSGFVRSALGELVAARAILETGAAAPVASGETRHQDVHRMILSQLALVLTDCGVLDVACTRAAEALRRSRENGRPSDLVQCWLLEVERCVLLRDRSVGSAAVGEVLPLAHENGFPSYLMFGRFYEALFGDGPSGERRAAMRNALAERRQLGDRWHESMLLCLLAEEHLVADDLAATTATLDEAEAFVAHSHERHYASELQRVRGLCALAHGDRDEAERALRRAVQAAHENGARLLELRAATALARLGRDDGAAEPVAHLAALLARFPATVSCIDVTEARAVHSDLAAR